MTQREKILKRFLSKPKNFSSSELKTMLKGFGYEEVKTGRTSGSRIAFFHKKENHIIRLHKPHPQKHLKRYQLEFIEEELKNRGFLK